MKNTIVAIVISLVVGVFIGIVGTAIVGGSNNGTGGTTASFIDAQSGFRVNGTTVIDSTGDITASGGNLIVTTSNTATSTATIGCVQTYATSTDTAIRFGMDLTSTSTASNQYGTAVGGLVTWGYGNCPF